jgi:PAS domain S-box-containing protein
MTAPKYSSFETLPEAIIVSDRGGSIVYANARADRLFGYADNSLVGRTFDSLIPGENRKQHPKPAQEFFVDPAARPIGTGREFQGVKKDGQEFPVEVAIQPSADSAHIVAVVHDMAANVETRNELRKSEQRFRIAVMHTADTLNHVNVQQDLNVWHTSGKSLMGYEPDEFPRTLTAWYEMIHPDDIDKVNAYVERVVENGEPQWNVRYRIRAKDGSYRHWLDRGTVIGFVDGRANEGVGAIVDETEQVLAQQKLEIMLAEASHQSALNRSILDSLDGHLAVLDSSGKILTVNYSWKEFASGNGLDSQEKVDVGANYLDACRRAMTPDADKALAGITAVLEGATTKFDMEYACHSPSEQRWFHMTVTPMHAERGGAVVTHKDITERMVARRNLEQARAEIERLNDRLRAESRYLMEEIRSKHNFEEIVGNSPPIMATLHKVEQVAATEASVLLLGETGTGKELFARAIHARSRRHEHPLIKIDCTTLPPGLVESELFGHEKGAFTGAHGLKPGRFEVADGGTIFLDEIGDLSLDVQSKLLRVVQEGEFQRLGAKRTRHVDVRVIAATNRDLCQEVRAGRFRSDLYYRIGVFPIEIPPLRDRMEDVPLLTSFFVVQRSKNIGKKIERISTTMMDTLMAYDWPGNVRELESIVERAIILSSGRELVLPEPLVSTRTQPRAARHSLARDLRGMERDQILQALAASRWKIKGEGNAASRLGLKPSTLRSRMKSLNIERPH